jgi:uncharacterized protein (TIGR01440 family)
VDLLAIERQVSEIVDDVARQAALTSRQILVVGCSTSEVMGKQIGKAGSQEVAAAIYRGIRTVQERMGFAVAFQCCEHLNRALVLERDVMERYGWDEVSVIPVPAAGGSMAAHAYEQLEDAVVVEHIQAHAGVDIGDTFIGMHLKHVAVPIRPSLRTVGEAHVTAATTRPKLIGGARAVYERTSSNQSCT